MDIFLSNSTIYKVEIHIHSISINERHPCRKSMQIYPRAKCLDKHAHLTSVNTRYTLIVHTFGSVHERFFSFFSNRCRPSAYVESGRHLHIHKGGKLGCLQAQKVVNRAPEIIFQFLSRLGLLNMGPDRIHTYALYCTRV